MVSKYIKTALLTVTIGKPTYTGTCVFNAVYDAGKRHGNTRDCFGIDCTKCPFSKRNLNTLTRVIKHE